MSFSIVTDASANLPQNLVDHHHIKVVPLSYVLDGKMHTCADLSTFDGAAYYDRLRARADITTSLVNESEFIARFRPLLKQGQDVLCIVISSGISGTYESASSAAAQLSAEFPDRKLFCVDTLSASLAEGLMVLLACELRDAGENIEAVRDVLTTQRHKMCQVFTVDDLMFLKHGGRLSGTMAIVGTVLHLKPLLKGDEEGRIVAYGKVRGRRASINALAKACREKVTEPEKQTLCIVHGDCKEDAEALAEILRSSVAPKDILIEIFEPVTGAHAGPGSLALFFFGTGR